MTTSKSPLPHALAFAVWLFSVPFLSADGTSSPTPVAKPDVLPASVKIERIEFGRLDPAVAKSSRTQVSREFTTIAFREKTEGGERVVFQGKPGPAYQSIYSFSFAPAGHRWSYEAKVDTGKCTLVVDGEPGPVFETADDLTWSADGQHYLYRVRRAEDSAWAVVLEGKVGEFQPGRIAILAISPDGAHHVYVREDQTGNATLAFLDGNRIAETSTGFSYSPFKWSENGATFAYVAKQGNEEALVIGATERGRGSRIDPDYVVLSRDGRHFAAQIAQADGKYAVVHDDKRYGPYKSIWAKPELSADGTRVAFVATLDDDLAHVVVDGKPGPASSNRWGARNVQFTTDGRTVAYLLQTGDNKYAIHAGDRIVGDGQNISRFWLSPDGAKIVWSVKTAGGYQIVVDGNESEPVFGDQDQDSAGFSPNGKTFHYLATRDRKSYTVRVAGLGGRTYELAAPRFLFPSPNAMVFVTYENGVFFRETWTLPR
jgi:hypothetical protein